MKLLRLGSNPGEHDHMSQTPTYHVKNITVERFGGQELGQRIRDQVPTVAERRQSASRVEFEHRPVRRRCERLFQGGLGDGKVNTGKQSELANRFDFSIRRAKFNILQKYGKIRGCRRT